MQTKINQKVLEYMRVHQPEMTDLLIQLVNIDSPSDDKPSLDRQSEFIASRLRKLGADVEILQQSEAGNHIKATWGQGAGSTLMLCHMDTVWPVGTAAERPASIVGERLFGPGSEDMKGGIVVTLFAMQALIELNLLPADRKITLLLNSDEEIGSNTSRRAIEEEALKHSRVFVMEPALPSGACKTRRKGVGDFTVRIKGRAAHAGADHARGVNAIEELARQVIVIQGFTNYESGTTVNVGVMQGGSRSNVVPEEAWAEVDVRIEKLEEGSKIEALMYGLKPVDPRTTIEVSGKINRPPMERGQKTVELYGRLKAIAADMGMEIDEASTGGASDGNFTAALGVPTLDGMGVVGDNGHALEEYALISSLSERAAVLAAMLIED